MAIRPNRRTFLRLSLAGAGAAVGFGSWLSYSSHRAARYLRQMYADSRRAILPAPFKPTPLDWSDQHITIAWLGHATVLINFYGVTILTDPALGRRVGVSLGLGTAGPKRYVASPLLPKQLPPIDLLLLSHAHMDHMDLPTLSRLQPNTSVLTAKVTSDVLESTGLKKITELGWNDRTIVQTSKGNIQVEGIEVKHWGKRWPSELARGYNGYILRREGKALLFGGDTANTPLFSELRSRGPFVASIMPIGAYQPWIRNHCTPEQALEMSQAAGARYMVPVHHQTFRLSEEPMLEPIERLQAAIASEPERLGLSRVGETFVCPET